MLQGFLILILFILAVTIVFSGYFNGHGGKA